MTLPEHPIKFWTPLALGLLLVGIFFRLYAAGAPLASDELINASIWAQMPYGKIPVNYQYPNNHIFHTILVSFILKTFGPHPVVIRIPVLIAGIGSLGLTYLCALQITGSRLASFGALTLTAFAASPIYYSTNARGYALLMSFALLTIWRLHPILISRKVSVTHSFEETSWTFCAGLFGLLTLGTWTIPTFVYFEGSLIVWIVGSLFFAQKLNRSAFWKILACLLLTLVAFYVQYFVVISPEMLKMAMSNAAATSSAKFIPQLLDEWTRPWNSFGFLFATFALLGIISIVCRNPQAGSVLATVVILPPLAGWLSQVLGWTNQIPDVRVFHYSISFFYMAVCAGTLRTLEWAGGLGVRKGNWKYGPIQSLISALLIALVVLWGIKDFAVRVVPALQQREQYHEIRNFIKSLGPYDLVIASRKHHIWFYLYGANEMRDRIRNILNSGELGAVYFMASFNGKNTDAKWVKINGRHFLKFDDFPPVQLLPGQSPHLSIPENILKLEKKIGSFQFFKTKPQTISQTVRLTSTKDRNSWILPKIFSNKVRLSTLNPTLHFQESFYMLSKQAQKLETSASVVNLFLIRAQIPESGWVVFSNGHLKDTDFSFDFTWRGNSLVMDHPYGSNVFERPWRFWVFISNNGPGQPTVAATTGTKRKIGIIKGLAAYSIKASNG